MENGIGLNDILVYIIPILTSIGTGIASYLKATKKSKQELKTLEESNKHEIAKLMKQHEVDIESLKEKHKVEMEKGESDHKYKIEIINLEHKNELAMRQQDHKITEKDIIANLDKLSEIPGLANILNNQGFKSNMNK